MSCCRLVVALRAPHSQVAVKTLHGFARVLAISMLSGASLTSQACAKSEPAALPAATSGAPAPGAKRSVHGLTVARLDGADVPLSTFAGRVLLVVNTASQCGYTPQYEGLEALHQAYTDQGFAVLGFPSNDFGEQEPGSAPEIAQFCKVRYGVTFPLFAKSKVKGADRSKLYELLGEAQGEPEWNFHKYLVDKRGIPVKAWPSNVAPQSPEITSAIEAALRAAP